MRSLDEEFGELHQQFGDAILTPSEGLHLVRIPGLALPAGWSQPVTEIRFVVPHGYPYAPPDCFWAEGTLRLQGEIMPQNAQVGYVCPGQPEGGLLWFSWHLQQPWNPSTCSLLTYVKVIRSRFEELR
jgi:hypothetical protein